MPRKKKSEQPRKPDVRAEAAGAGAGQQESGTMPAAAPPERTGGERPTTSEPVRPDPQRIAARAYELYLARGGAEGRAMDDWLAAEGELMRDTRDTRD